jgi:hypothetical protein
MRKSINEFNSILTETEKLSTTQLCLVRGGDGEDLRRNTSFSIGGTTITTSTTTTTTGSTTTISGTITLSGTISGTYSGSTTLKK